MRSLLIALVLAAASSAKVFAVVTIDADDPNILYTGRIDFSDPLAPVMWWPGCDVIANFEGTSVGAKLNNSGDNYFYFIINDGPPAPIHLRPGARTYTLATGLTDSVHTIRLFKRTETLEGEVAFEGFELEDGKSLVAPPVRPQRRIEFYGDSITSGHSVASTTGDTNDASGKDNYYTYASVTARNLDAEYHCISVSGIGLYVDTWAFGGNMRTLYYDRTTSSTTWDFRQWTPQLVVVNLGQNDYWGPYTPAGAEQAYVDFTLTLRSHYPDAQIILALGSMNATAPASPWPLALQNAVGVLNGTYGDPNLYGLIFPFSGNAHPTVARHAVMADQLTGFIQNTIPGFQSLEPTIVDFQVDPVGGTYMLDWESTSGAVYQVESGTDLESGPWSPEPGAASITATNGSTYWSAPVTNVHTTYRVIRW